MNDFFNSAQPRYTDAEVARVREVLQQIGYVHKPEGAYYPEPKFDDCLDDHVKLDAEGKIVGIVTLHLDPANLSGQDSRITIARDKDLPAIIGRATTIHMFASMGEIILQRLVPKKPAAAAPGLDIKPA